jgi:hypothetical protein
LPLAFLTQAGVYLALSKLMLLLVVSQQPKTSPLADSNPQATKKPDQLVGLFLQETEMGC